MKIRAFIALKPPAGWISYLDNLQEQLRQDLPGKGLRWVAPEQIHVTLRFLGNVVEEEIEEISRRVSEAASETRAFNWQLGGLGCFPSPKRPRVLWAGLCGGAGEDERLYSAVNKATADFGEPPEKRKFTPHLTLARIKELSREETQITERLIQRPLESSERWLVNEVLLMRSHLSADGSCYEVTSRQALVD